MRGLLSLPWKLCAVCRRLLRGRRVFSQDRGEVRAQGPSRGRASESSSGHFKNKLVPSLLTHSRL